MPARLHAAGEEPVILDHGGQRTFIGGQASLHSQEYQAALRSFSELLENSGLDMSSHVLLIEAAGHEIAPHLEVFFTSLQTALPVIGTGLTSWFAGRYGRKVRVKVGDIEVEANTAADAEKLLRKAQEIALSRKE